jgi:excisionase family DNA binding protein
MPDKLLSGFLTPAELADELNLKVTTLKAWRRKGTGPNHTTIGKKVLYRRSTVIAWIAARERSPERGRRDVAGRRR